MTRRIVAFTDVVTGITYKTPEFNGDKAEQLQFMGRATCKSNWDEIFKEFDGVSTLKEFKEASERAQNHWQPFYLDANPRVPGIPPTLIEVEILPIEVYVCAGINIVKNSLGRCIELHYPS